MFKVLDQFPGETAKNYAHRVLLYNITNFYLTPGEKLIESELCKQLMISRTPIREAILELSDKKIIDIHPKKGTYVSLINPNIIDEFLSLRFVLERDIAKMAAASLTHEHISHLKENVTLFKFHLNERNFEKALEYDIAFHRYIYETCNKSFWFKIVQDNSSQFNRLVVLMNRSIFSEKIVEDHEKMIDAFQRKDTDAAIAQCMLHSTRYLTYLDEFKTKYPELFV